jgi:hypothetical protein
MFEHLKATFKSGRSSPAWPILLRQYLCATLLTRLPSDLIQACQNQRMQRLIFSFQFPQLAIFLPFR